MKPVLKVAGIIALALVAVLAAGVVYLSVKKPAQRAASSERIEPTPERLARGKYLVHHASDCLGCHSDHDNTFSFPVKAGTEGAGGFAWDASADFPGFLAASNITSDRETGLGSWTDGEILRAIREGVDREGKALFPIMPYKHFRNMSDDDAKAVVAYLRTLPPVRRAVAQKKLDFPLNFIEKFVPQPLAAPVAHPDPKNSIAYGKYLTRIGGCYECHTPHDDKGELDEARAFAGGWEMKGPWGRNITSNITPHPETFVGRATREEFIGRFHATLPDVVPPKGRNTIMPWRALSGMTAEDLGAIYDYLKTVPPVENKVNAFPDATANEER
ncbi:MAG TPA: cytochrome c [Thermoanaerobaculia bacterium]|jgi:mono/diheme cytochrome c family protein